VTDSGPLRLEVVAVPGIPEVQAGDDLARLIAGAVEAASIPLRDSDVVVVAQKVVSKAEGRVRPLADVRPSDRATQLAARLDKDPRMVELVLEESTEVLRAERGVLITRTRHGFVCANGGVDASNVPGEAVALLPEDSDSSARSLRDGLGAQLGRRPAVVISDSFGRAWRLGQAEVAIGCAGLKPLDDRRGERDAIGKQLTATMLAVADEAAAAAGLVRDKQGREAVAVVRGLDRYVTEADGPGAAALLRPRAEDLFS
jgi:coenzyme F420-0:L-glutamate ligase / coenzyme F420-1:gamma-L-glutamate ligase